MDKDDDVQKIQWFQKYPHLLNLDGLVEKYPWTEARITYNAVFTSYRKPCNCAASCVLSLTTSHNELVNAWTHIFGFFAALGCLLTTLYNASYERVGETAVLSLFAAGGMFMFISSAIYHTFCCHSDRGSQTVQCMDWLGIAVFTFVSNLVVSYFEIFVNGYNTMFYVFTAMNFILATFSYYVTCSALTTTYIFRTSISMMYALGSLVAWIIGYALTGKVNDHLVPILGMYLCFGTVVFCLLDFPEAFFPKGTFDIIGASHQIFHVGIIGGFLLLWGFFYKMSFSCTTIY
jgi:adiponectin receptor